MNHVSDDSDFVAGAVCVADAAGAAPDDDAPDDDAPDCGLAADDDAVLEDVPPHAAIAIAATAHAAATRAR